MSRIASRAAEADIFEELNPAQRRAVEHRDGPLLVIAGAGTGKTKTLCARVAGLLRDGADPARILLLTFSRRAATDMRRRVGATLAQAGGGGEVAMPWAGTFHAIGAKLLRELAPVLGLSPDFTIHDRSDSAELFGMMRQELGFGDGANRFPTKVTCLNIYSRVVNAEEPLADALARSFPWCRQWEAELKKLFAAYVDAKQKQSVLDYDDLLLYWADAMESEAVAAEIAARFDHVLVDEYQDTNRLQARILLRLMPDGRSMTVVGDDAQAIYSFRAATVRNILDFPAHFSPPAAIVKLEENYRSTSSILGAANAVMERAQEGFSKTLRTARHPGAMPRLVDVRDEAEQARYVAEQILEARERGVTLKNQAVLFRAADHSAQVELELQRRDIPFVKFGGLRFLEAAHVKDLMAILRWAANRSDRLAGFRTLQLVPGIGPSRAARVLDAEPMLTGDPLDAMAPPAGSEPIWNGLCDLMRGLRARTTWPTDIEQVARWYEPVMDLHYDDARVRSADIRQLVSIANGYPGREAFLTDLTLDPPNATSDEAAKPSKDDDYCILSTIHSAKGQEWRNVFVLSAVDGCIPSDLGVGSTAELEEERRLLYVAMTRARDDLHVIVPQRFYVQQQAKNGDRNVFAARTRFIGNDMLERFDRQSYFSPVESTKQRAAIPPVDLAARARERWK
ncbi:MAG TPA: ATP-dependent helicase [Caulobacterales bacterium]|nr:ATP-dependent helicase [Caulobacterales bacterium]